MKHLSGSFAWLSLLMIALAGCTPLVEGAKHSAKTLEQARDETAASWTQLFIYNPKPDVPQAPSTRFCYQFQTDIVCYDAPQPQLTAKLVGAQNAQGSMVIEQTSAYDYNASSSAPVATVAATSIAAPYPVSITTQSQSSINRDYENAGVGQSSSQRIESHDLATSNSATPFHAKQSPYVAEKK